MSKLVDKERLAKLAKALDDRAKAAVAVEKGRAEGAEAALAGRIAANEAFIAKQPGIDKEQDRRLGVLEGLISGGEGDGNALTQLQNSINAAQAAADKAQGEVDAVEQRLDAEGGLVSRIAANEANIARLDGAVNVEGSVKKQIKDAIDAVNGAADALEDRVEAVENFKNVTYPAAEQKVREDFAAADAQVLADAKKYADEEITKLVDSAPDAMNTLNELAEAIKGNEDIYKAYVEEHAAAMTKMKEDLQKEIDDDVKAVVDAQKLVNDAQAETNEDFEARIAANEAFVAAQPAVDAEQDRRIKALEDANAEGGAMAEAVQAAQDAADAAQADVDAVEQRLDAEGGLVDRIEANEANIARMDGDENVEGSFKKQLKVAIDGVNQAAEGLADRVEAVENFRDVTYPAAEAKVREDFAAADAQVLADAKKYADEEITKLVDSAPDAMNTLNELAEAIKGNEDIYKAYVEEHAAAMTKMKEDLQKEIDDDVKAVVDAQKLVNDAQAETNEDFEARIAANEAFVAAQPAVDAEQDRRIKALEDANAEGGAMAEAVQAAQDAADAAKDAADAAQGAADAAQADVDAVEKRLDDEGGLVDRLEAAEAFVAAQPAVDEAQQEAIDDLVGRMEAMEAFEEAHDHSVMEQGIADNKAAIEKEVEDRDAAIEEALKAYSTTEEMKQVIGNVVNSLALTMENDQVVLKLGGIDGIQLASVALDMATDDDIDAIIAGLDAPAGE